MFRCRPTGSRLYESREICKNLVTFVNVKTVYKIDEDLVVDYTVQNEFKSSTRDWIGIFPRNWLNLQQYLTFEYTTSLSPNGQNPLNRTITFPRIFHREASLNLEYQFVYISKEIHIMAMSTSFRFNFSDYNELIQPCSCMSEPFSTIQVLSDTMLEDHEKLAVKEEKSTIPTSPGQITVARGLSQNCLYCHRPVCGLKIDTLRGDFLAAFSDSLLDRVHRLETDLSFAENALKNAKGARENLAKRLRAYEAFVAEMLSSLAARGIVKITDDKGKEIVLQRVNERPVENESKKIYALEDEIVALKSLLKKQQQTIVALTEQRKFHIAQRERTQFVDRQVQTNSDRPLESDPLDLTVSYKRKENLIEPAEKQCLSEKINLGSKVLTLETDTNNELKKRSKDSQAKNVSCESMPAVLKIQKPSGILVQGKNVKFAIVRF